MYLGTWGSGKGAVHRSIYMKPSRPSTISSSTFDTDLGIKKLRGEAINILRYLREHPQTLTQRLRIIGVKCANKWLATDGVIAFSILRRVVTLTRLSRQGPQYKQRICIEPAAEDR